MSNRPTLPTSPLSELVICVRDIFAAVGDPAKVLFGRQYLTQDGAPRRVVFVPAGRGKWTRDYTLGGGGKGYVGGIALGCLAYVWGRGDKDPFKHWDDADDLADRVLNALGRAAPGCIDGGDFIDATTADDARFGEAYKIAFIYTRGVPRDRVIFALKNTEADPVSPPDLDRPPGSPASTVTTDVTSTPET